MTNLTTLKDKDPREVAKLLSAVASSLLPNPGVSEVLHQTGTDREFVRAVLSEIRSRLRVREGDQSVKTQSQIYAFISKEISKATLTQEAANNVESRLGNRGELHPSRYEVRFAGSTLERLEATGNRGSNVIEVVRHPDQVIHLKAKYVPEEHDPHVTISIKSIATKRAEDGFILFVYSIRSGKVQYIAGGFRLYPSDVKVDDPSDPIDVVRSFANNFGATFHLGGKDSKFMLHEVITVDRYFSSQSSATQQVRLLDRLPGHHYASVFLGGPSTVSGADGEIIYEVILGFVFDQTKYLADLRRHHVNLRSDVEEIIRKSGYVSF